MEMFKTHRYCKRVLQISNKILTDLIPVCIFFPRSIFCH
jgi:hypothetical protein